jgi:molybdenum cofactor biosynthesis enzyme
MNPISHKARTSRGYVVPGYQNLRDSHGIMGFTKLHDKGHVIAPAGIASILWIASFHRAMPEHHAIYMEKVRKLRTKGTWL